MLTERGARARTGSAARDRIKCVGVCVCVLCLSVNARACWLMWMGERLGGRSGGGGDGESHDVFVR